MNRTIALVLAAATCALGPTNRSAGDDWPHWRGPSRNGISREDCRWDAGVWPPREAWRREVGEGASSPIVVGTRLYVLGWKDGHDRLVCLDVETGREIWHREYPSPRHARLAVGDESFYSGPSSTPEFDAATGLLYTLGADGDLQCWDTRRDGERVWGFNLHDRYRILRRPKVGRSSQRDYGFTSSPLVLGDALVVEVGAATGTLVAFDKRSGEERWRSEATDPAGHTGGPVPIVVDGTPCVAVQNFNGLLVANADPTSADVGRSIARWPWQTDFANNIATVAVHGQSVLLTSGYNQHRIARLDVTRHGAALAWERPLASKVCTPVIHDGSVFWAWRGLHCLDFATGRTRWEGGRSSDPGSCVVTGDGRLLVCTDRGDLRLLETPGRDAGEYRELALLPGILRADAWPHVVLSHGRIFCKDRDGLLVCLSLSPRATAAN